jgi:ribosomal protein S18 acetylase RimI-like enzyme
MPQVTDANVIRSILELDRPWTVYALADLEPDAFRHTKWFASVRAESALVLVYRAFDIPIVLSAGEPEDLRPLVREACQTLAAADEIYGVVRCAVLPLLAERYVLQPRLMSRMVLARERFQPMNDRSISRLGALDLPALGRLYANGEKLGESPEFFIPSMLESGVYMGVQNGSELLAAAGTHVVAQGSGVAAIGNIYTRRDCRRHGLGIRVTSAVIAQLVEMNLRTIVLNVRQSNKRAARLYKKLGFEHYCDYYEVPAFRRGKPQKLAP